MSERAFFAYLRAFPTMAIELIPIRRSPASGELEILFIPRGDDPIAAFAGRLHTPGTVMRPGDTVEKSILRVLKREIGISCSMRQIVRLPSFPNSYGCRGYEIPLPIIVGPLVDDVVGTWIPISRVRDLFEKDQIIATQYTGFLKQAIEWLQEYPDCI